MTEATLTTPTAALGTWAWGDSGNPGEGYFGSSLDQAQLESLAERAQGAGFTLWDTALVYGMGRSEQLVGEVLRPYGRDEYQLSTKFTPQIARAGEGVAEMLQRSLANLRTDYIDLYWIHNPADVTRWTPQLIPLLQSGAIRSVGVSNHNLDQIQLADSILGEAGFRVAAVQNHYSLLYRSSENAGILDYCREHGLDFYSYMVLEQGALTGRYTPENPLPEGSSRAAIYNPMLPQLQVLTERLASIGAAQNGSIADVAIAWAMAKGTVPIIGVTKPSYVDGLVRASAITLTEQDIAELDALGDAANVNTRGSWERAM